jgi:hypothetical protein
MDDYAYRTFHKNKRYELDIRIAYFNPANADSCTIKKFALKAVHRRLKKVLNTFEFAKWGLHFCV